MMNRVLTWLRTNRTDVLIMVALFVLAAVPRLLDLGTFLTADEKNWIGRSYEFIRAFKDYRFNDTLQTTHPGVTTMWLTGLAVTAKMLVSHVPFSFRNLHEFVWAAQFPIALLSTAVVPAAYFFLRRLFSGGRIMPLLAAALIALNPFLIGYSRVTHVDAVLAGFVFLAALATIIYARTAFSRRWLVVCAVLTGLAFLTKAPAVFLIPFWILTVLVAGVGSWSAQLFREWLRDFVLWILVVALLFILIWPAFLWVPNPEGNVLVLKRDLSIAAATPHHMVEDYTLNPWHYPATLLTRTSPITLGFGTVFIISFIVGGLRQYMNRSPLATRHSPLGSEQQVAGSEPRNEWRTYWLLIAYIFFFILMMTLGAKKGDRYILPVFPMIDVLAALGMLVSGSLFAKLKIAWPSAVMGRSWENWKLPSLILSIIAVLYLAGVTARYHPYAIAYSNPLFADNLSQELGWGEGLEQVGAWLSEHDPNAVVASWYPEELGAYTSAQVAHINAHAQSRVRYVVLYHNMFGRAPDHYANDFIDEYYKKREPVFVASVAGKEFAWVYEKRVYERVVGELVPGVQLVQQLEPESLPVTGIEILVATYSGKATAGQLVVELRSAENGAHLHQWRVPVGVIEDDQWLRLELPEPISNVAAMRVHIRAEGTSADNAPTIRYTRDYQYRPVAMWLSTSGEPTADDKKDGNAAVHAFYQAGEQVVREEETRILQAAPQR